MTALSILQLYPAELGVSGDGGNVVTLAERARRAGHDVEVVSHRPGDDLPSRTPDVIHIGSGPLSTLRAIQSDLMRFTGLLGDWIDSGVPVVAIGGGMEILSKGITGEGSDVEGLGVFDATAHRGAKRRANYFEIATMYGGDWKTEFEVFGFEDHATRFELGEDATPFGAVMSGGGNIGTEGPEGVLRGAAFGTQLKGPALPLNPELTDRVLTAALARIGGTYATNESHVKLDEYARQSRLVIQKNLEHVFKAM